MGKPAKIPKPPDENDKKRMQGSAYDPEDESDLVELRPEQPTARPSGKPPIKGVRCMADIMPERINWLWPGYLAAGKLSLLIGDPGLGKSTLTCEIVARLSRGEALPGTTEPPAPLVCGLCCPEDDPADTIRPRLDAAAVELERVFVLDDVRTIPDELPQLEAFIRQHSLGLVVIDPIMSFLSGKHDSHRDQDVRRALTPLVELAQRTGCAVLAVMHQNKRQGVAAMYRAGGSIGFVGLARTAMMLAQDPDDPERRVLAQVKNNLAKERKAHRLRLITRPGHEVAAIEWLGECDLRADDLCGPPESAESRSALHDAKEFLREQLADGPKPRAEVMTAGKKEGHAERTLRRARREIDISNSAIWALPAEHAPKGAEG